MAWVGGTIIGVVGGEALGEAPTLLVVIAAATAAALARLAGVA